MILKRNTQCTDSLDRKISHYENLPMQYTDFLSGVKIENFIGFLKIFFLCLLKTKIVGTR